MVKNSNSPELKNYEFYDSLSGYYDGMIKFDNALKRKAENFANFITPDMKTAADFGCGSGVDAIALTRLGLSVTGFDSSHKMVSGAIENAKRMESDAEFSVSGLSKIPKKYNGLFDFICSTGNTIANLTTYDLQRTFEKASLLLKEPGVALFHILNYERILKEGKRILNISENESFTFVRFYEYKKSFLLFNVLIIDKAQPFKSEIITTKIYPHLPKYLIRMVKNAGFKEVETFGNERKDEFKIESSFDLFLYCKK